MRSALLLLAALGGFKELGGVQRPSRVLRIAASQKHDIFYASISPPSVPTASSASDAAKPGPPFFNAKGPQDDEAEFRLNVGKVIDTLQADYPLLFEQAPDFSIFEPTVELTDPSGVSLKGLALYRNCFLLLRMMRYGMASAEMRCKVSYAGWDPYKVRVRWNLAITSVLAPSRTYFIDGVSAYTLSQKGLVRRHSLENIIVNGREVEKPFLTWINPLSRASALPAPTLFQPEADGLDGNLRGGLALPTLYRAEGEGEKEGVAKKQSPRPLFRPKSSLEFCEESYDCEYPLFCCDLLLAKVCCSNGAFAPVPQSIPIPIPIPVEPDRWGC